MLADPASSLLESTEFDRVGCSKRQSADRETTLFGLVISFYEVHGLGRAVVKGG